MISAFLALSLLVLVPSCLWRSPKQITFNDSVSDSALDLFFDSIVGRDSYQINMPVLVTEPEALMEYEARLTDIPSHVSSQLVKGSVVEDSQANQYVQLQYQLSLPVLQIQNFYCKEMERLGWCDYAVLPGNESILLFEKPDKICSILLRPLVNSTKKNTAYTTTVLLTVGAKIQTLQ